MRWLFIPSPKTENYTWFDIMLITVALRTSCTTTYCYPIILQCVVNNSMTFHVDHSPKHAQKEKEENQREAKTERRTHVMNIRCICPKVSRLTPCCCIPTSWFHNKWTAIFYFIYLPSLLHVRITCHEIFVNYCCTRYYVPPSQTSPSPRATPPPLPTLPQNNLAPGWRKRGRSLSLLPWRW